MSLLKSSRNSSESKKLFEFTNGVSVDALLAKQEVRVQKAWAEVLAEGGYLSATELKDAQETLDLALQLILENKFEWKIEDEDIHMNLERFLTEKKGALGKKIHLGRSRNDLIATTLRLYVHDELAECQTLVKKLLKTFVAQAEATLDIFIPGMTHLQQGQPIRLAHFFMAHAQAFSRDLKRLEEVKKQSLAHLPLGSGALAGCSINISLENLAKKLSFEAPTRNSYDSVGDRDFIVAGLQAYSLSALHLSRFSEDSIFYASSPIRLFLLPPDWSTGSSLMPNKRNPDVPELCRAKSAKIMSAPNEALMLMKGLPLSYNSDLHELKNTFQRVTAEYKTCLEILPNFVGGLKFSDEAAKNLCGQGHILATDLAEDFVKEGLPFREAYKKVAALVEEAQSKNLQIHEMNGKNFSMESSVEKKQRSGGTARQQVEAEIARFVKEFL